MKTKAYAILSGLLGTAMLFVGVAFFVSFFAAHAPGAELSHPVGPNGVYFMAFSGSALVAWGGCLIGQIRASQASRSVATATVLGLVLSASYRIAVWVVGDYWTWPGNLARVEAVVFLLLALAFLWLRPEGARRAA
jgi:hypothetical protein